MNQYELSIAGRPLLEAGPAIAGSGATTLLSVDSRLLEATLINPTAGAITVTLTDNQGTPVNIIGPLSLAANGGFVTFTWKRGRKAPSGLILTTTATGIHYAIQSYQP